MTIPESRPAIYYRDEPLASRVTGLLLAIVTCSTCASFLSLRVALVKDWRRLPLTGWIILLIYSDSFLFVLGAAIVQYAFGSDKSPAVCQSATLMCLSGYLTSKLIYLFLADRAHLVRGHGISRLKSKLWLFNTLGMTLVDVALWIPMIIKRISRFEKGHCVIGVERKFLIVPITFDASVSTYATSLFVYSLMRTYKVSLDVSSRGVSLGSQRLAARPAAHRLRKLAIRTLIGACFGNTSSIANLVALLLLDGQPAWLCLLCCKADILINAVIIFWVTMVDSPDSPKYTKASTAASADFARPSQRRVAFPYSDAALACSAILPPPAVSVSRNYINDPKGHDFGQGSGCLSAAVQADSPDLRAESYLGGILQGDTGRRLHEQQAMESTRSAV